MATFTGARAGQKVGSTPSQNSSVSKSSSSSSSKPSTPQPTAQQSPNNNKNYVGGGGIVSTNATDRSAALKSTAVTDYTKDVKITPVRTSTGQAITGKYDASRGGYVTSEGKVFPTSNPSFVPEQVRVSQQVVAKEEAVKARAPQSTQQTSQVNNVPQQKTMTMTQYQQYMAIAPTIVDKRQPSLTPSPAGLTANQQQYPEYVSAQQKGILTQQKVATQLEILRTYGERQSAKGTVAGTLIGVGVGAAYIGGKVAEGAYTPIRHPIQTIKSVYSTITNPVGTGKAIISEFKIDPLGTIAKGYGQSLTLGAGIKATQFTISKLGKPELSVTGSISETSRISSDKLIVDATKQRAQIISKKMFQPTKKYDISGISTEKTIKIGDSDLYSTTGKQAYILKSPAGKETTIKLSSVGRTKVSETGAEGFKLIKGVSKGYGKTQKYNMVSLSKESVTSKGDLTTSTGATEILNIGKRKTLYQGKTSSIGISKTTEIERSQQIVPSGESVTASKFESAGLSTSSKAYLNSFKKLKNDFKQWKPKNTPKQEEIVTSSQPQQETVLIQQTKTVKPTLSSRYESLNIAKQIVTKQETQFSNFKISQKLSYPSIIPVQQYKTISKNQFSFDTKQRQSQKSSLVSKQVNDQNINYKQKSISDNMQDIKKGIDIKYMYTPKFDISSITSTKSQSIIDTKTDISQIQTPKSIDISTPSFPSPPLPPVLSIMTPFVPPSVYMPSSQSSFFRNEKVKKKKGFKQKKKYTPTFRAVLFGIKGKGSKIGIFSGLGERGI